MPFGLKNAPQIYQLLLENAIYGLLRISSGAETDGSEDLFKVGEPDEQSTPSIPGQRSYIDDILIPAESCDALCTKGGTVVECVRLLKFIDQRSQEFVEMSEGRLPWISSIQRKSKGSPERPPISGQPTY